MASMGIVESHVEEATLAWLGELGYQTAYGPDVEPEKLAAERDDFTEVVLSRRLRAALERINPDLPSAYRPPQDPLPPSRACSRTIAASLPSPPPAPPFRKCPPPP